MMKLFIYSTANYSEDGDLETNAIVYTDLDKAKASLKEDYDNSINNEADEESGEMVLGSDPDKWISDDGMSWGTRGPNQSRGEIIVHELMHVKPIFP